MIKLIRHYKLRILGFPKSLYFNLKYFGIKKGLKLPVLLSHRVKLKKCGGSLEIKGGFKKHQMLFGYTGVSISPLNETSVWNNNGRIVFIGTAILGVGTKIFVNRGGN